MIELIIAIVKEASSLVKDAKFDINAKSGNVNIVTSSDLLVQRYLHEKLSELFPESGFYCEEEDLQEIGKEFVWVIDPIDGTMNYARAIPESAISVALLQNNVPILGVVQNIFTGDVYTAVAGQGAKKNGMQIPYNRPSTIIAANNIENHKRLCEIVWKYLEKDPEDK